MYLQRNNDIKTSATVTMILIGLATVSGIMGLAGWIFDSFELRSFFSTGVTMKVNTAIFIIATGTGLACWIKKYRYPACVLLTLAALISIISLYEHLSSVNLGIDEFFFSDTDRFYVIDHPGRISLMSSISGLILICSAFAAMKGRHMLSQILAFAVFTVAYTSLLGHAFGILRFYYNHRYSGIASHTAIALIMFAAAIMHTQIQKGYSAFVFRKMQHTSIVSNVLVYILIIAPFLVAVYLKMITLSTYTPALGFIISLVLVTTFSIPASYLIFKQIHRIEGELWKSNEKLRIALMAGNLGSYEYDLNSGDVRCDEQQKKNFGYEPNDKFTLKDIMERIVPEHREEVKKELKLALETGQAYQTEYQIRYPGGKTCWIRASGQPQFNVNGDTIGMVGVTWIIRGRDAKSKEIERLYEQLKLAAKAGEIGLFDNDLQNGVIDWDRQCRRHFGISHKEPISFEKDFMALIHPEDRTTVAHEIEQAYANADSDGEYNASYRVIGEDGKMLRWLKAKGKVLLDEQKTPYRFVGTITDITTEKEEEMRKNDFIGMASHELRTPLTSLKAYLQTLITRAEKENDQFQYNALGRAERQVKKMSNMISAFLDVARIGSGKITLRRSCFSVNELIEEIVADTAVTLPATHSLHFDHEDAIEAFGDREKIGHVISNLLSNAIKYSPQGGMVSIKLHLSGNRVRIAVEDEGIGLAPEDAEKLFQRFYRVKNEDTTNISGFGIGLYLSAEILKLHSSSIQIDSEHGKGSSFSFELPAVLD